MTRVVLTPFERRLSRAAWKATWRAAHPDAARERNRRDQATWRAAHRDTSRANSAAYYAWIRARRMAAGWVPMTRTEVAKMGQAAMRAHRP